MKKLKGIVRIIVLLFVGLILGMNVYLWNAKSLMGNVLPMPFGYGAAVVLSGSMEPAIMTDDLILVAEQDTYQVGDVIVYQSGSSLIVHRIVETLEETLVTRGDANNATDAPIRYSDIKGKVTAVLPGMGMIARVLKKPAVVIVLLAGAVVLIEVSYRREQKKDDDKIEEIKAEIRRLKEEK